MAYFQYHPDVLAQFPQISGGLIWARGLQNQPSSPDFIARYQTEQTARLATLGGASLSELPSLAAWRKAFRQFGTDPTQYRIAAEALLRRLQKKGDVPSINLIVDVGNWVSMRYALPVAAMDARCFAAGGITVAFAAGSERFTELGASENTQPDPGEAIFVDEAQNVHARRWCWRQSAASAAREDTQAALIVIEAQHPGSQADIEGALALLTELLAQAFPAAILEQAILGPQQPRFDF